MSKTVNGYHHVTVCDRQDLIGDTVKGCHSPSDSLSVRQDLIGDRQGRHAVEVAARRRQPRQNLQRFVDHHHRRPPPQVEKTSRGVLFELQAHQIQIVHGDGNVVPEVLRTGE